MSKDRAPLWQRSLMSSVFVYEQVALFTDWPTVSHLARRHPWLAGAIVGGLVVHFRGDKEPPR